MRKPFQGVTNIIRFNWHFYAIALMMVILLMLTATYLDSSLQPIIYTFCGLVSGSIVLSLLASLYVYDLSGLYRLNWITPQNTESQILNIHAGFDETSALLKDKFRNSALEVLDFYDPQKHTEVSIKRARKAYPPFSKTKQVETSDLQLQTCSADKIFVIFSAHEIRNIKERALFFQELARVLKPQGQIYITEHLRDLPNFVAYNIGFCHFYSRGSWLKVFRNANLNIRQEIKLTPFVSTFILDKNGNTL
ncbi:methyltransferase domain-containing protein [Pontibacter anaerobius]|uniref:Methyltransferase domain-containing protein n=1 Tax=Pontibacter anaerobius TaxID=2993940 RepID=A0ABT3RGX5_9BACT|nr:methyltransferase domain-containing protein [Pontibacter anaerobius]MCX2741086.1 methyltransferase domain-containing protein [Pontibacter anaerobius]